MHTVGAQARAARTGEDDRVAVIGDLAQPRSQHVGGELAQRRRSFLAALADHAHVRAGAQINVMATQCL
jgi:hypothetical protein